MAGYAPAPKPCPPTVAAEMPGPWERTKLEAGQLGLEPLPHPRVCMLFFCPTPRHFQTHGRRDGFSESVPRVCPRPQHLLQGLPLSLRHRASCTSGLVFSTREPLMLSRLCPAHTHACHTGTHFEGHWPEAQAVPPMPRGGQGSPVLCRHLGKVALPQGLLLAKVSGGNCGHHEDTSVQRAWAACDPCVCPVVGCTRGGGTRASKRGPHCPFQVTGCHSATLSPKREEGPARGGWRPALQLGGWRHSPRHSEFTSPKARAGG